jgi:uncharacterized protein YlxW (UPF0749 family)
MKGLNDMSTLIQRLRSLTYTDSLTTIRLIAYEAADTIEALSVAIERSRESYLALEQKAVLCKEELLKTQQERDALQAEMEAKDKEISELKAVSELSTWAAINRYQNEHIALVKAAVELIAEVEANLETKPSPLKYGVPFGAVNNLRAALRGAMKETTT